MTLTFWSWISFWTNTNVVVVVYQTPSIIKTRGTRTCWNCKKNMHIQELIFIFAIYVRLKSMYGLRSMFSPQICVFQQIHVRPQIRVLSSNLCLPTNPCTSSDLCPLLKSVSSNKSMSYEINVPPNPCPFIVQICVLWNRFSLKSVSSQIDFPSDLCPSLWQKNDVIIISVGDVFRD